MGEPRVIRPEDIADALQIIRLKGGEHPLMHYPSGDLVKTVQMFAEGLSILSQVMESSRPGTDVGGIREWVLGHSEEEVIEEVTRLRTELETLKIENANLQESLKAARSSQIVRATNLPPGVMPFGPRRGG